MTKEQLIQQIRNSIKTNGVQEITGTILQGALVNLVETLYNEIDEIDEPVDVSSFIAQQLGTSKNLALSQYVSTAYITYHELRLKKLEDQSPTNVSPSESDILELSGIMDRAQPQEAMPVVGVDVYFVKHAELADGRIFKGCLVGVNSDGIYLAWEGADTYGIWVTDHYVPKTDKIFRNSSDGRLYVFSTNDRVSGDLKALNYLTPAFSTTYADLKYLVDAGQLIPGAKYRITDFVTTCSEGLEVFGNSVSSAGHAFDIIVTANSATELDAKASACLREGDTYFASSRLGDWELKYDINNDIKKYTWADGSGQGKGVIYFMRDELGNEAPYDFKNIMYGRNYTFGGLKDASLGQARFNKISEYWSAKKRELSGIVLLSDLPVNNVFGDNCYNISLLGECLGNSFQRECRDMVLRGEYFLHNDFGKGCANIDVLGNLSHCKFGDSCGGIIITGDISQGATWYNLDVKTGVSAGTANPIDLSQVGTRSYHVTTVAKNSAGYIKIYIEADLVQ